MFKIPDGRIFSIKIDGLFIVNLYINSGFEGKYRSNQVFLDLVCYLQSMKIENLFFVGDFNSIYERRASTSVNSFSNDFIHIMKTFQLYI